MSTQESKDYARGYAAGKKRLEKEDRSRRMDIERINRIEVETANLRSEHWRETFYTVLNAIIIKGNWQNNGKNAKTPQDYIAIARFFADEAIK